MSRPTDREIAAASQGDWLNDVAAKVAAVISTTESGKPWKYNPQREMFVGTTNALEMYEGVLDLGRDGKEWVPIDNGNMKGFRLSDSTVRNMQRVKALGEFLETAREDMSRLIEIAAAVLRWTRASVALKLTVGQGGAVNPEALEYLDAEAALLEIGKRLAKEAK